jgi:diaminohydroxyphosphoribosylaminopyrimidine deaminase/5-amino-6-(5-phosphoribosylamino)uracil reductase
VRRVVIAVRDPNPEAGGGIAKLQAAGIIVEAGVEEEAAGELNAPFLFTHTRHDRPFVTLKLALSAEGAVAPGDRSQQWLTGDKARQLVHKLRAGADAVMVGIGTAVADDPALTVRQGKRPRVAPKRVVLDRSARLPLTSQLARTARKIPVEVLATEPEATRVEALERAGVKVHSAPSLDAHLQGLRERGVRHLFVEGGAAVADALVGGGFVDRLIIFRAPVHLGAGALVPGIAVPPDEGSNAWMVVERRMVGVDQLTVYRPTSR